MIIWRKWMVVLVSLILSACASEPTFAPVTDISMIEPIPRSGVHQVKPGETLYEIAWRYGLDYRTIAALNHIQPPYTVRASQVIHLRGGKVFAGLSDETVVQTVKSHPVALISPAPGRQMITPVVSRSIDETKEPSAKVTTWLRPAKGRIIKSFSSLNKGINIAGKLGEPVVATASGKVVYAGEGLRGYGKLIIIKHNSLFLSAYAHNSQLNVREGQWVKQGQKIAEMGDSGTNRVMLHFEIRRAGKPMNPRQFLIS